jgi:hypothetical protein
MSRKDLDLISSIELSRNLLKLLPYAKAPLQPCDFYNGPHLGYLLGQISKDPTSSILKLATHELRRFWGKMAWRITRNDLDFHPSAPPMATDY